MKGRKIPILSVSLAKEKGHISSNCPKKGTTTNGGGKGGGGKVVAKIRIKSLISTR